MPCDTIQEVSIEFGEATDLEALAETLEALGMTGIVKSSTGQHSLRFDQGRFDGQSITFYRDDLAIEAEVLKRAYTKATVLRQADRFGWTVRAKAAVQAIAGFSRSW